MRSCLSVLFTVLPPELLNTMTQMQEKLTHIERRAMNDNMKPAELVRQVGQVIVNYRPEKDQSWPMRQIRGYMLDYMRAVSMRNSRMDTSEKIMMCRVCLFEACKLHGHHIEGDLEKELKYDLVVGLCRETEVNEQSFSQEANLFVPENLSMEDLMQGYEKCNAYAELKEAEASKEAILELKTILHENYDTKIKTCRQSLTSTLRPCRVEVVQQQR